ncbi:hypothetical protein NC653_001197 [Populus alba x Populus x berolinensis]|uniref:BAH domain-containing protein n=1 Tax=Populus alba x Populus x berolinensis TaxID=444605 RepID=A0AAD6RLG5_9ROSI|nr:hypothetical protein NC653_001197 [Populus alba x Populus x berolinensis]
MALYLNACETILQPGFICTIRIEKNRAKARHRDKKFYTLMKNNVEDPVLLAPETKEQKPGIATIKDLTQTIDGMVMVMVMVTGQWLYRPEEAEKNGGGSWQIRDTRELFYSTHHVEVPAKCVMHKCEVHFVPVNKQLPDCRKHPSSKSSGPTRTVTSITDQPNVLTILWMQRGERRID